MQFLVNRERLSKALTIVSNQVLPKSALPILTNILLETEKDNLKISATNLELGMILKIPAKVAKSGKTTIPAKSLTELITTLDSSEINFSLEASEIEVKGEKSSAKLPIISADEFPSIPAIAKTLLEAEGGKLSQTLERVIFASSIDSGRPILTGVLIEFSPKEIRFVATDGYRLSCEKIPVDKKIEAVSVVVPAKTLNQLAKVITDGSGSVKILYDPAINQIGFDAREAFLVSRLVDGTFPDWEKIIPKNFKTTAVVLKKDFLQAVKVASVFAKEAGNTIKLVFAKNLEVHTQSSAGTSQTLVPAKITGDKVEIAFNWRYLTEALQAVPGDSVEVSLVESLSPAKFTPIKPGINFFHIIMPVRI